MGIGLVISYLYFTHESPRTRAKKMADIFKNGKIYRGVDPPELVKRENLENALKEILQLSFRYFLITGEYGTGKTTLVQNTILNLKKPKVHYSMFSFLFNLFTFDFLLIGCYPFLVSSRCEWICKEFVRTSWLWIISIQTSRYYLAVDNQCNKKRYCVIPFVLHNNFLHMYTHKGM